MFRVPTCTAVVLVLASLLAASEAAAVSSYYNGSACRGASQGDQAKLIANGPVYYTNDPVGAQIVCPLIKTTSAPGLMNDSIISVDVGGFSTAGHSSSVRCTLTEYQTKPNPYNTSTNIIWQSAATTGSGSTINFTITGSGIPGHFDGYATPGAFIYAELSCWLDPYAGISWYQLNENGNTQNYYRIVSAALCASAGNYHYNVSGPSSGFGGYLEQDYPSGFYATCPMPAGVGSYVQIALGPAISGETMGARRSNSSSWQWVSGSQWDPQYLLFYSGTLICAEQNDPVNGDGKVFAYRTF